MRIFTTKDELRNAIKMYFNGTDNADDIGTWDTSHITDMSNLFKDIPQISVEPIELKSLLKIHQIEQERKRIIYKAYIKLGVLNVQRCNTSKLNHMSDMLDITDQQFAFNYNKLLLYYALHNINDGLPLFIDMQY